MNSPLVGLRVASVLAGLIAVAHVLRLLAGCDIAVGTCHVPLWLSLVAAVIAGALCVWFWQLAPKPAKSPEPGAPPPAVGP